MSMLNELNKSKKDKRKEKIGKFILVGSLSGLVIGGLLYNRYTHSLDYFKKELKESGAAISSETEYGTIDTEEENLAFSLANVGNRNDKLSDEAKAILSDTKIPTGIITRPECTEDYEIYLEADYALELVSKYKVEYPVFLDVDGMFYRYINKYDQISDMVDKYVEKLQANGVYVSVIGKKGFLETLKTEKRKTNRSLDDDEKITYTTGLKVEKNIEHANDELYDIILGPKYVCAKTNFKPIINKEYNNEKYYVDSFEYVVKEGDSLSLIADKYDININDLRLYNNIGTTIYPGQKIIIPGKYQPAYYRGIDVSSKQGIIDWKEVSSNIDFTIIRAGYTTDVEGLESPIIIDPYFHYNISECNKNNIPVGIYYTSKKYDKDNMKLEAQALLKQLNDYEVNLPIYINIPENTLFNNEDTRRNMIDSIDYFCSIIKEYGYTPGVYVIEELVPYISELEQKYTIWSYGGIHYSERQSYNEMNYDYKVDNSVPVFQPTKSGEPETVGITESFWLGYDYAQREVVDEWLKEGTAKVKRFRNK